MKAPNRLFVAGTMVGAALVAILDTAGFAVAQDTAPTLADPAAWGSSHVGQEMPAFEDGNTCLFCHRHGVGDSWATNAHQRTIHEPDAAALAGAPDGVDYLLGDGDHSRYLRRGEGYGTLDIWSDGAWDNQVFGASCLGCHASGADSASKTFAAIAVDCFMCHGIADPEHTAKPELMLLSNQGIGDPRVVTAVCASCHIRSGTSRSTGLPYPNQFVAGDNVFIDLDVDLSAKRVESLAIGERHIYANVRDVLVAGEMQTTCVDCHEIHPQSSEKHKQLPLTERCFICHKETGPMRETRAYERHSALCGY